MGNFVVKFDDLGKAPAEIIANSLDNFSNTIRDVGTSAVTNLTSTANNVSHDAMESANLAVNQTIAFGKQTLTAVQEITKTVAEEIHTSMVYVAIILALVTFLCVVLILGVVVMMMFWKRRSDTDRQRRHAMLVNMIMHRANPEQVILQGPVLNSSLKDQHNDLV